MFKKCFAAWFLAFIMLGTTALSASAHGGHRRMADEAVVVSCPLCSVEGCTAGGRHIHGGITYCGYSHEAGVCDGKCRALCTEEGCTVSGFHQHGGRDYCGYSHESGFCDGSCQADVVVAPRHGHHGHHGCR